MVKARGQSFTHSLISSSVNEEQKTKRGKKIDETDANMEMNYSLYAHEVAHIRKGKPIHFID